MASDLKIGHYLKIPPRMIFLHQIAGTIIGCIFNYVINNVSAINDKYYIYINDS